MGQILLWPKAHWSSPDPDPGPVSVGMCVDMFCVCGCVDFVCACKTFPCMFLSCVCVRIFCLCFFTVGLCEKAVYVEANMAAAAAADPAVALARHSANEHRLSLTQRWAVNQSRHTRGEGGRRDAGRAVNKDMLTFASGLSAANHFSKNDRVIR